MGLLDCYIEIFYYTIFLKSMEFGALVYDSVRKHYKDLFLRAANAAKKAGYSKQEWDEGLFAVCAWIDEIILCSDWQDKEKWSQSPFQLNFFNTTNAGEEFFTRLENLNKNDIHIRRIYDYCLALGFQGRYYNAADAEKLDEIKLKNLKQFTDNSDLKFPDIYFPGAYARSSISQKRKKRIGIMTLITLLGILLPVILFTALYLIYSNSLSNLFLSFIQSGY